MRARSSINMSLHLGFQQRQDPGLPHPEKGSSRNGCPKTAELLNDLGRSRQNQSFSSEPPSEVAKVLIKTRDPEERKITLSLLGYPGSSVGRLMTPRLYSRSQGFTVREVIQHIREVGKDRETIDVVYVVDDKGRRYTDPGDHPGRSRTKSSSTTSSTTAISL